MEEIYWLQRVGNINTLMWTLFGITVAITLIFLIIAGITHIDSLSEKEEILAKKSLKKAIKTGVVGIVLALVAVFIPTTNEMYAIYGIGGTIDYLKENETAKQLPDKVVNALDKWIDNITGADE